MNEKDSVVRGGRLHQGVLIATFLPFCWLAMMAIHELGHVLAAWSTGGKVTQVVLHPLAISRTDVAPNPRPFIVVWAGPLVGVGLPLIVWMIFAATRLPGAYLLRFLAGFCLIANGAYLGVGSFDAVGDAGTMLHHGSPIWSMWLFGAIACPSGLMLWHRLGPNFGLGAAEGRVEAWSAWVSALLLVATLLLSIGLSPR